MLLGAVDFQTARRSAYRIVLGQFGAGSIIAGLVWLGFGQGAGISALLGGVIAAVPSLYMAMAMFRRGSDANPKQLLAGVYVGEALKILLTAALFVVAIVRLKAEFLPLFGGYIAATLVYWLALLRTLP